MSEAMHRKLAAIISADVVGYSRLMGADEANTLAALRLWRAEVFEPTVNDNNGNVIKNMGDGWLVEFDSAGDAVNCAIRVQEKLSGHEVLKLRIGLHIGDITHADGDIYGDGVNIAARLQEIAEPGAIVISDVTRRSVDGKLATAFSDLGQQKLKNITEPIIAFGWGMTAVQAAPLPLPEKPSIAVLPFNNMSGDPEQEYFSDGISEDIITELSRFSWIKVIARNSSFSFKGQSLDLTEIGRTLGVRYLLEGSVRRAGDRVRITAQLIEAENGGHLWAERYDRDLTDIFAVQDEITNAITNKVAPHLQNVEISRARRRSGNLDCWDLVMRARFEVAQSSSHNNDRAVAFLEQALEIDPDNVMALTTMAGALGQRLAFNIVDATDEKIDQAKNFARNALEYEPNDTAALRALGFLYCLTGDHDDALRMLKQCVAINQNEFNTYYVLGLAYMWDGQIDEAAEAFDAALTINPVDLASWQVNHFRAFNEFFRGNYEETVRLNNQVIVDKPNWPNTYLNNAAAYAKLGDMERARISADRLLELSPSFTIGKYEELPYFSEHLDQSELIAALRAAGLPQ